MKSTFDSTDLPTLEPRTQCVLMPRDPDYIYAYWDYTEEDINHLRPQRKSEGKDPQIILRVYDVSLADRTWDVDVGSAKNWYIQVGRDNTDYRAEIGLRYGKNRFIPLVASNLVHTPPKTSSRRHDLIWQDIKNYRKSRPYIKEEKSLRQRPLKSRVYQLTSQDIQTYYMKPVPKGLKKLPRGVSWQKVRPLSINQDLNLGASENKGASESLFSMQSGASEGRLNKRKFFFEVWTEVIVHGRTESDATVRLNEKGIKLNPDGTFSLRYALPDGEIPLKFIAQSSDGVQQLHIHTGVEREKTIGFPKTLKHHHG